VSICRIVFILMFTWGLLAGDVVYTTEVPAPSVATTDAQGNAFTARVPLRNLVRTLWSPSASATPGEVITLFGRGLGPGSPLRSKSTVLDL
jgi:hypothetical protein